AGDARQLATRHGPARDLELLALALDDGLVGIAAARPEVDDDLAVLALGDGHALDEAIEAGRDGDEVVAAGRDGVDAKTGGAVGLRLAAELAQGHGDAGEVASRATLLDGALERRRGRRLRRGGLRLRGLRLGRLRLGDGVAEVDHGLDLDRARLAVELGGAE